MCVTCPPRPVRSLRGECRLERLQLRADAETIEQGTAPLLARQAVAAVVVHLQCHDVRSLSCRSSLNL